MLRPKHSLSSKKLIIIEVYAFWSKQDQNIHCYKAQNTKEKRVSFALCEHTYKKETHSKVFQNPA